MYFWPCWSLLPHGLFSSGGDRGYSLVMVDKLLIAVTSLVAEPGLYGVQSLVVAARGLNSGSIWI